MNLYKLDEHQIDGQFIIREYEVVKETPKYWFAQMRNISNERVMHTTFKTKKDTPGYFHSPDEAIQDFIEKQERKIETAEYDIAEARSQINMIERDLEDEQ